MPNFINLENDGYVKPSTPMTRSKNLDTPVNLSHASYGYNTLVNKFTFKTPKKLIRRSKRVSKSPNMLLATPAKLKIEASTSCLND